eukprot:m.210661 g.210661  ORF g.210661 m.210661 type:complete len:57 (+) comp15557_c2_seq15:200-370(+)
MRNPIPPSTNHKTLTSVETRRLPVRMCSVCLALAAARAAAKCLARCVCAIELKWRC